MTTIQTAVLDGIYALHKAMRQDNIDAGRVRIIVEFQDVETLMRTESAACRNIRAEISVSAITATQAMEIENPIMSAFRRERPFEIFGIKFQIRGPKTEMGSCNCENCRALRRAAGY